MIADLAGRSADAAEYYRLAASGGRQALNLREAQILASWQMRQGQPDAAAATMRALAGVSDDIALAAGNLLRAAGERPVASAADGVAETYLEMAAALRAQDADDFAQLLLRLALDLRPDFSAARLMLAEIDDAAGRPRAALDALERIPLNDPLAPMVALRQALLRDAVGETAPAIADLKQLAEAHPRQAEPLVALGDLLRQHHRYAEAISAYTGALALLPKPATAAWNVLFSRGVAYDRAHDWPRAEADLRAALKLAPGAAGPVELSRLFAGRSRAGFGGGAGDDRTGAQAAAQRCRDPGQHGLGDAAPGQGRGRREHAAACGRGDAGGRDDQRPSGRCLLGGGRAAAGGLSVAAGVGAAPRAARRGEPGSQAAAEPVAAGAYGCVPPARGGAPACGAAGDALSAVPAGTETAPAKVNLYLHILGRRPDGYHRLDSLAVFPAVGDRLTAAPAASLSLDRRRPVRGRAGGRRQSGAARGPGAGGGSGRAGQGHG